MKKQMQSNTRKWIGLTAAVFLYYLIHEGSHFAAARIFGAFEAIRPLGLGLQVVVAAGALTDKQNAAFCAAGMAGTLFAAYLLVFFSAKIAESKQKLLKAACYYATLALLLLDPLYFTILYQFVGGGDMNGLLLIGLPEIVLQLLFGTITAIHIRLIVKTIYPLYKRSFCE